MSKCPNCSAEVEAGMKFCGECGAKMPTDKECPQCHTRWPLTAKFCGECGYSFNGAGNGGGSVIGDKNVIAGDVHIDQSSTVTNNTVNNVTNTTNNVVNNVVNQDDTKKVVQCVVCGKQLPIVESCVCSGCHGTVCKEHFDIDRQLCTTCVDKWAENNKEEFKKSLVTLFTGCSDGEDPEAFRKIEKQCHEFGISIDAAIEMLTYLDDETDERRPVVEGIDKWFLTTCKSSTDIAAKYYVGKCYEEGIGTEDGPELGKAVEAYKLAAGGGVKMAEERLAELDPYEIHISLKAKSFAEIGLSRFTNGSSGYSLPLDERKRYRVIAQHERQYRFPLLNGSVVEVSTKSLLTGQWRDYVVDMSKVMRDNGVLLSYEDWDCDADGGAEYLVVSKYRDGAEFFGHLVISGTFDAGKLTFACENYDDNFSSGIGENERLKLSERLCGDESEIVMVRAFEYQGRGCEFYPTGYWESSEVLAKTSHLFTHSAYDWEFDVFSNKQNIRRLKVDVFGPGVDIRCLEVASSRLKEMTKYDIPDWDATWNLFTFSNLQLDLATLRVTDVVGGGVLYEGPLADKVTLVEREEKNNLGDMISFRPGAPDACGITVIYNRRYEYHRIMTCCYDGDFSPSLIEVPWFGLEMFCDGNLQRLMCEMMELKMCEALMQYDSDDGDTGEPMDIVGIDSWIQYKDRREPWGILTLEDALKLQEKSGE